MDKQLDPYAEWLDVKDTQRPLTFYQLLGLAAFEDNIDRIEESANRLIARVKAEVNGPHVRLARRTLYELESAKACLLDIEKKSAYDASLFAKSKPVKKIVSSASVAPSKQNPTASRPANKVSVKSSSVTTPSSSVDLSNTTESVDLELRELEPVPASVHIQWPTSYMNEKPWYTQTSALAGCAALASFLLFLVVYIAWPRSREIVERPVDPVLPKVEASSPATMPLTSGLPLPGTESSTPPAQQSALPVAPASNGPPVGQVSASPPPTKVATEPMPVADRYFRGVPTSIQLPSLDESLLAKADVSLTTLEVTESDDLHVGLLGKVPQLKKSDPIRRIELKRKPDANPPVWTAFVVTEINSKSEVNSRADAHEAAIANFLYKDGQLGFQWLPGAIQNSGNDLRNCALELRVDKQVHRISLRTPELASAVLLDLDEETFQVPIESAYLPPLDWMRVQLVEVGNLALPVNVEPADRIGTKEDPLRIILRKEAPSIEIRLRLIYEKKGAKIVISPVMVDTNGRTTLPFSTERVNTMHKSLTKELAVSESRVVAVNARQAAISGQIGGISASTGDPDERAQILAGLQSDLNNAQNEHEGLMRKIPLIQKRLAVLPSLAEVGNRVHKLGTLKFCLYFDCEGHKVDVLRVE